MNRLGEMPSPFYAAFNNFATGIAWNSKWDLFGAVYQKVFVKEKKAHGFLKKIVEGIDLKNRKAVTKVIFHLQLNSSEKGPRMPETSQMKP